MTELSRLPLGLSNIAEKSANSPGDDAAPSIRRFHHYEVVLVGVAVGAIVVSAQDSLSYFASGNALSYYFSIMSTSTYLFINPLLVFLLLYSWCSRRVLPHLREKHLRIAALIFVGTVMGSAPSELIYLFLTEAKIGASFFVSPNFIPFFLALVLGLSITVTFVGLGAFMVAYFRHIEII